jgi:hypothetical protein
MVAELSGMVGESGDDIVDGTAQSRRRRLRRRVVEIQEEVIQTHTLAQRSTIQRLPFTDTFFPPQSDSTAAEVSREVLPAVNQGDPTVTIVKQVRKTASRTLLQGSEMPDGVTTAEMDDWIEVEELLREVEVSSTSPIPEAKNGSTLAIDSYKSAVTRPQENAKRLETILRTFTIKLMQKKTTLRQFIAEHDQPGGDNYPLPLLQSSRAADCRQPSWQDPLFERIESMPPEVSDGMRSHEDIRTAARGSPTGALIGRGLGKAVNKARIAWSSRKRKHSDETTSRSSPTNNTSSASSMIEESKPMCVDESSSIKAPGTPKSGTQSSDHEQRTTNSGPRPREDSHLHDETLFSSTTKSYDEDLRLWPPCHLVSNLHRYMRCA